MVLRRFWEALAARLERNGLQASGRLTLTDLDRSQRHAMSDLLGRPVTLTRTVVDLALLDERLRARAGADLVQAAERVRGAPLVDRPAERHREARRREAPLATAARWFEEHPEIRWPWAEEWLRGLRRDGVLSRDPDPERLVSFALDVLWDRRAFLDASGEGERLRALEHGVAPAGLPHPERAGRTQPGAGTGLVARTELAARTAYDAHGLDDDRRLAAVVLRALAVRGGTDLPTGVPERRALWESAGVLADAVSSTCLTWRLRLESGSPGSERFREYADAGVPLHVTWWDLRSGLALAPEQDVLVCENPRVLEAVAEASLPALTVVCTSGRPALVVLEVLSRLRDSGARLRYHGDFDWPGVAMANDLRRQVGVQPWRMSAEDYAAAPASLPLGGPAVAPGWDPELGAAMRHRGLAVHEEAVLGSLLAALAEVPARVPRG